MTTVEKVASVLRAGVMRCYRESKTTVSSIHTVRATCEQRKGRDRFDLRVAGRNGSYWQSAYEVAASGGDGWEACEAVEEAVRGISQEEVDRDAD